MALRIEEKAFLLSCGAGFSTLLGAVVLVSNRLFNYANDKFVAGVSAIAAGVMLYVSVMELSRQALTSFKDYGYSDSDAYLYSTVCFFAGMALYLLLEIIVEYVEKNANIKIEPESSASIINELHRTTDAKEISTIEEGNLRKNGQDKKVEIKTGLMLTIAVTIHNFPEGVATFVATLNKPSVGITIAVAIAIHNIPEGLCIAIPVYQATGSRMKAFSYVAVCSVAEPIGAALAWTVLQHYYDDRVYGATFGVVAGIMTILSLKELLPIAIHFDPSNKITTKCLISGMLIMATSLILFEY